MSSLPINNLLNQTISIIPYIEDSNDMGDKTYGTAIECRCRIDYAQSVVYGLDGSSIPSVATVYVAHKVSPKDKLCITLTDTAEVPPIDSMLGNGWTLEGDTITREPLSVKTLYDGRGRFSHCEVAI